MNRVTLSALLLGASLAIAGTGCVEGCEGGGRDTCPGPEPDPWPDPEYTLRIGEGGCVTEGAFCGHGAGLCAAGVCRAQCSPVDWPRCDAGLAESHRTLSDGADSCLCVPPEMAGTGG